MWRRLVSIIAAAATAADFHNPGTPDGVPPAIDCETRSLAYEFGKGKVARGDFGLLYDAMQLAACDGDASTSPREPGAYAARSHQTTGKTIVVALDGDDANPGTAQEPVATLAKGLELCSNEANCTVAARGGTYELSESLLLTDKHAGLTLQNYDGENVTISGGVSFSISKDAWTAEAVYPPRWETHEGMNNVFGLADVGSNTSQAFYVGTFDEAEDCAAAVVGTAYVSYTHHSQDFGGDFAGQCFGRISDAWIPKAQENVVSGRFVGRNTWSAPVPDHVPAVPGLRVDGRRAIRAKFPDGDPERSGDWLEGADAAMGGGDYVYGWVPLAHGTEWVKPFRKPDATELIANADDWPSVHWPMSEKGGSEWTGEGDWGDYHLGLGGYCDDLDPPVGYWCSMNPPRGQCWDKAKNEGSGCTQTHMSPDGVVFERARNYENVTGAVVQSWRGGGRWFTQQWRVAEFVAENDTLLFDKTTGFQGGEGMTESGQFWIENVKEECDAPREWWFDVDARRLFYNPNSTAPPTGDEQFIATSARTLINVSGTPEKPVRDVTIRGISFVDALHTYLDPHGMPSGGDWALQRNGALTLEGTERLTIENSEFTRLDGNAINVNGYHRGLAIYDNDFSWIGDSCIALWGHTGTCLDETCKTKLDYKVGPDGRAGEQPHGTVISKNVAREIGLWQKQSSFVFQAIAYATRIVDNVHFNGPRAGINFNDGFGGADVLEGNLLANCVRESGDHGPFNSWDRVPYITNFTSRGSTVVPEFRQIRKNFVLSVYSSQEAIDTDDGSAYYNTTENFFAYGASGLKSDFGGHDNYHERNVYAWCSDCWGPGNMDRFVHNKCIANAEEDGFATDCHGLAPYMDVSGNTIYTSTGNLSAKICDPTNVVAGKWPSAKTLSEFAHDVLGF
mmetsp:Transcript_23005/g.69097  ORF Transcript_23005/g.69097 Transcript_23005/m.69097 type:complete len:905 (-) Transcript_23005:972-3686(-)